MNVRHGLMLVSAIALGVAGHLVLTAPAAEAAARCQGERATIVGGIYNDRIRGTRGADVIVALSGHDFINGRGGPDLICAGPGEDTVFGGPGNDRLYGQLDKHMYETDQLTLWGDYLDGGAGTTGCGRGSTHDSTAIGTTTS